jgi:quinol monooxygenase YgiN
MRPVISTELRVHPHLIDRAVELFRELQADVNANEPGTVFYQFNQKEDDPTVFWAHEIFADEAAKQAHLRRLLDNQQLQADLAALNAAPPQMTVAHEV